MRKLPPSPLDLDLKATRSTRRVIHGLFLLCLGLLIAPLAYEIVGLCAANWQAMYGGVEHVETPILDTLDATYADAARVVRTRANRVIRSLPWQPTVVITLGLAWALFMSVPLRRS